MRTNETPDAKRAEIDAIQAAFLAANDGCTTPLVHDVPKKPTPKPPNLEPPETVEQKKRRHKKLRRLRERLK